MLGKGELAPAGFEILDKDIRESSQFTALIHHRPSTRSVRVHGHLNDLKGLVVNHTTYWTLSANSSPI